ncbi:uncharacterized protein LOC124777289 [Schistocerca piceifrons]|uniref:uncharacterized protein LOC124777289 n=1 Tax=Schistocerca piceifrons TaxID=274613 RepID=UPI001F5F9CDD|nr:uncharacterized protein LOC124777289 [Schistocerca piceifrons]
MASRLCSVGDTVTDPRHQGTMVWECIWQLLVALLIMASPRVLLADDSVCSSASGVSLSGSSFRNLTGHWITKAAVIRKSRRDISEQRPLHYDIDITSQNCGDVEKLTTVFTVVGHPLISSGCVNWRDDEPNYAKYPDSTEGEDNMSVF